MADIPKAVQTLLPLSGLKLRSQGKVRDQYDLPDHPDKILVVASDRISIFDFVLAALIGLKGEILTALSFFWVQEIISKLFKTDLIACGSGIDIYLPENLRSKPELQKRSMVIAKLNSPKDEDIVRNYLVGTGWESYKTTGFVCGHKLPPGLIEGSRLPFALYTPTTKAIHGHDEHVFADDVIKRRGFACERRALQVTGMISEYAESRGIIFADTKWEWHDDVLIDEKATPDSSRFWDKRAWEKAHAKGTLPPSFDKQYVRDWGKSVFVDRDKDGRKREPTNPDDLEYVHSLLVPRHVCEMTTKVYRYIFWRLTGMKLERFQRERMHIAVEDQKPRVEIIIGSESDRGSVEPIVDEILHGRADYRLTVGSCHRNPEWLRTFAQTELVKADRVVSAGGMAIAKPGVIKAWLCEFKRPDIAVLGVALEGRNAGETRDAVGSIAGLPGEPIELDQNGRPYLGREGVRAACLAAVEHEFLPRDMEAKPVKIGEWKS